MVFDDEFSTFLFMRQSIIPPNWTDIVKHSSWSGVPENIDLKDTWLATYFEEDPRETPTHSPGVAQENNRNIITLSHPEQQLQKNTVREGASVYEVIKHPVYEGVWNTSN